MRIAITLLWVAAAFSPTYAAVISDHTSVAEFDQIPIEVFESVRSDYRIFYGHTSHGSQIMTGLGMLETEDPVRCATPPFHEISDDLGHNGDTSWVIPTRSWLDAHPETNVVMWSWCGGCSDNTEEGIALYLAAMESLESEYPNVVFIYMTGHLDGSGPDGDLYRNNNQIREYCLTNDKVLFDFADIESWDPDGNYYPDESDACGWCSGWCAIHTCPGCGDCAHSHCFNCYLKGKGFWWMMAQVNGWHPAGTEDPTSTPAFQLVRNQPNPFGPSTSVRLRIAEPSWGALRIFNTTGRQVTVLHEGRFAAGEETYLWDGTDSAGQTAPSGTYLCHLRIGEYERTLKMTLLR